MTDWRRSDVSTRSRTEDQTGHGSNKGVFVASFDTASGENQSGRLTYAGGTRSLPIPMPFDSTDSWIRCIPEASAQALVTYRTDTQDVAILGYINEKPSDKIDAYRGAKSLYRPLLGGEIEIMSVGKATSYYSTRPNIEHRGGMIRAWLDQDRLESGSKAPLHKRQLWEHLSAEIGDEERFGVVRRPIKMGLLSSLALGLGFEGHSSNFEEYPYPDFSLPGGVPAAFSLAAKGIATASEAVGTLTGTFKVRPFAKEYLRVIKNPLSPIPPDVLVDVREGQVFNDKSEQETSDSGAYLRAKYEYFTPFTDSTSLKIDELGNTYWSLSLAATDGYSISVPLGSFKLDASTGIDMSTYGSLSTSSLLSTSISATLGIDMSSTLNTSFSTGLNFDHSITGMHSMSCNLNSSNDALLNYSASAGVMMDLTANTMMSLTAPLINIGQQATDPTLMGTAVMTTMLNVFSAMLTAAPMFTLGNLGYPTVLDPSVVAAITQAIAEISSIWPSKTIFVGP